MKSSAMKSSAKKTSAVKSTEMKSAKKTTIKSMKKSTKTVMKTMKTAKRVSRIAKGKRAKAAVFRGVVVKTKGGLKKNDLKKSKSGKIVSKKKAESSILSFKKNRLDKWVAATTEARKKLGITGFCPVGGTTARGSVLLKTVRSIYKK